MHQSGGLFQAHMALVRCRALKTHFQSSFFVNVCVSSCSLTSVYMASRPLKSFFVLGRLVLQLAQGSQIFMWQLASKKQMPLSQEDTHLRLVSFSNNSSCFLIQRRDGVYTQSQNQRSRHQPHCRNAVTKWPCRGENGMCPCLTGFLGKAVCMRGCGRSRVINYININIVWNGGTVCMCADL